MGLMKSLKGLTGGIKESLGFSGHDKVGNTVGQWMNNFTGASDMYNQEYAGNVALWNMQNEYNTPVAQIARMKAAGIDVNPMTYAVGNGNMSTAAGNISAPSVGAGGVGPIGALMSVFSGLQNIRNMKATEAYVNEQRRGERIRNYIEDQAGAADIQKSWLEYDMMKSAFDAYKEDKEHKLGASYRWSRNLGEWMSALSPFVGHVADDASYQFFSRFGRRR